MKKNNKKGFTIVELVIVIAVIAILAGVLIPTFSSIIKKANLSADQQAVRQINGAIAIVSTDKTFESVDDLTVALLGENIDISDYSPMTKDHSFYWVKSENKIVLVDKDNKVVFPEDLKTLNYDKNGWEELASSVLYNALGGSATIGSDGKVNLAEGEISYFVSTDSELNLGETVITYNLNDEQMKLYGGNTIDSTAFCANGADANLVLNDGTIETNSNGVAVRQGATATINGTTIKADTHCVYAQEGTITITGGFFECTGEDPDAARLTLNCADAAYDSGKANIVVTGGTFVNFNPAESYSEGTTAVSFVAEGYTVEKEVQANGDTWYIVVPE